MDVYSYQKTINNNSKALDSIFTAAICFYTFFHQHCEDKDKFISENIDFEFYHLGQEKTNSESDNHNRLCPFGPNLYNNGMVNLDYANAQEESGNMSYGMRIVNNSGHDLYVNVFIFSLWDFGVGQYLSQNLNGTNLTDSPTAGVHVRSNGSNSRYSPDVQLKKNGRSFAIGYGNSASEAFRFEIPNELDHAVWFLKIYLSTKAVNLEHIKQSPTPSSGAVTRCERYDTKRLWSARRPWSARDLVHHCNSYHKKAGAWSILVCSPPIAVPFKHQTMLVSIQM